MPPWVPEAKVELAVPPAAVPCAMLFAQRALSLRIQSSVGREFPRSYRLEKPTMMRSTKLVITASAAIILACAGVLANASNGALSDAPAAISLSQAVTAAEQHVTSKATRAEYEQSRVRGQWVYDVEVVVGNKVYDVRVDPTTGGILSSTEDAADRDDDHDKND